MKQGRFILKCICFFAIFSFIFVIVQENLRDKWMDGEYNVSQKTDGFYAEDKNTIDVVFVGSSQMYADMSPAVIFDRYGIASYDFCANEQPLWVSYYYIKEAIKRQSPDVIVLDVFTVYGDDYEDEGVMHINLDDLPFNLNKMQAIRDGVPKDLRYSYYFPLAKYHQTWTDLYQDKSEYSFYHQKDINKGYSPFIFAGAYEETAKSDVINQMEKEEIPERAKDWLYKIIDLCKEENTALVLIKTPNGNADRQKLYNSVADIAIETETPFYNMNTILDGQAHINMIQAEKVSALMGEYLKANYDLPDHRKDEKYQDYYASVEHFNRQKKKCEVISASDFSEYIRAIKDDRYLVVIALKNENQNSYDKADLDLLNETFGLHLNAQVLSDYNGQYFAVVNGDSNVIESIDSDEVVVTEDGALKVSLIVDSIQTEVISSGNVVGADTSIMINGTDFSLNVDGYNIAIYDKALKEMIEMSAFDINDNMNFIRK